MDEDFPTSPSKRRRTMESDEDDSIAKVPMGMSVSNTGLAPRTAADPEETRDGGSTMPDGFLDVLLQQVEAESAPIEPLQITSQPPPAIEPTLGADHPRNGSEDGNSQLHVAAKDVEGQVIVGTTGGLENIVPLPTKLSPPADTAECVEEAVTVEIDPQVNEAANEPSILKRQSVANLSVSKEVDGSVHTAIMMDGVEQHPGGHELSKTQEPVQEGATKSELQVHGALSDSIHLKQQPSATLDTPAKVDNTAHAASLMDGVEQHLSQLEPSINALAPEVVATEAREWETDSSPYESSDSDSSSDTDSDDSDEDEDAEYSMLDPEEQARILMQDDGGSDDEGGKAKEKSSNLVRTANERVEEVIPKPNIEVTPEMQIEVLGSVEATVESTVVVKAKTSGEYQVLESGSLLCLKDRSVVGVVAETIGRVEQPMYTIRFTNDTAIEEAGLSTSGTTIYYVPQHSTFVFTQPLKGLKGSDASNFHDEEVGDEEIEFSDDEKEADHKRQLKLKRQGRLGRDDGPRGGRGGRGRGRGRGDYSNSNLRHSSVSSQPESIDHSNGALNYDDDPEDGYTPLPRPTHELPPMPMPPPPSTLGNRGGSQPNRSRGSHRGNRGGRGRGGGGSFDNYNRHPPQQRPRHQNQPQHTSQVSPPQQAFNFPSPSQFSPNCPPFFSQSQQTPHLTPQSQTPFAAFSPSPISPLPGQQFNFGQFASFAGMQQQPQPQNYHSPNMSGQFNAQPHGSGQQQGQSVTGNGNGNAAGNWGNTWPENVNQDAAMQVKRQLEELNRLRTQGPQGGGGGGSGSLNATQGYGNR